MDGRNCGRRRAPAGAEVIASFGNECLRLLPSSTDRLTPLTVALSLRPFHSVIFVPQLPGIPWQSLYRLALRGQTATWGGWGNLVLPMPSGDGADEALLWALLDVFDADAFHSLPVRVADLKELAPDYYRQLFERAHSSAPAAPGSNSEGWAAMVTGQLDQQQLVPFLLSEELQKLLVRRVAPLSAHDGGLPVIFGEAADPPSWPLVAVEELKHLPEEVSVDTGWPDDDLALMGALVQGEFSPRLRDKLESEGMSIRERQVHSPASAWQTAFEPGPRVASQELTSMGLAQYWRPGAQLPGLVLCIGDEPWDFAFACARDRMQGDARWMPSRAVDDFYALAEVARIAARVGRRTTVPLRVCSVSSPETTERLLKALSDFGLSKDINAEICDPLDLVPISPGRLYERERVGFYQSLLLHHGTTPPLPTPVPRNVGAG